MKQPIVCLSCGAAASSHLCNAIKRAVIAYSPIWAKASEVHPRSTCLQCLLYDVCLLINLPISNQQGVRGETGDYGNIGETGPKVRASSSMIGRCDYR